VGESEVTVRLFVQSLNRQRIARMILLHDRAEIVSGQRLSRIIFFILVCSVPRHGGLKAAAANHQLIMYFTSALLAYNYTLSVSIASCAIYRFILVSHKSSRMHFQFSFRKNRSDIVYFSTMTSQSQAVAIKHVERIPVREL
jgi:hypothetical protein